MDIVLLNPHSVWTSPDSQINMKKQNFGDHLGLRYIASVLEMNGFYPQIIDVHFEEITLDDAIKKIDKKKVDIIGITTVQPLMPSIYQLVRKIRQLQPLVHICLGGYGATFSYQQILEDVKEVDSIILGEGEYTFLELVKALSSGQDWQQIPGLAYYQQENKKIVKTKQRPLTDDIDTLPFPKRADSYPTKKANIIASRGCHGHCLYCSIIQFYKLNSGTQVRIRNPEHVVKEIEYLNRHKDVSYFEFLDDNFLSCQREDHNWVTNFCSCIIEKKLNITFGIQSRADDVNEKIFSQLKKVGLKYVSVGIESDSPRMIKSLGLGTSQEIHRNALQILYRLKIEPFVEFILFEPYTEISDLKYNLKYMREINFTKLIRQMPISWTQHLVLYKELPITRYYENKVKINEENYTTHYQFVNPEIEAIVKHLIEWRKKTSHLANHHMSYYHYIAAKKGLFHISKKSIKTSERYLEADLLFLERIVDYYDYHTLIKQSEINQIFEQCYNNCIPIFDDFNQIKEKVTEADALIS